MLLPCSCTKSLKITISHSCGSLLPNVPAIMSLVQKLALIVPLYAISGRDSLPTCLSRKSPEAVQRSPSLTLRSPSIAFPLGSTPQEVWTVKSGKTWQNCDPLGWHYPLTTASLQQKCPTFSMTSGRICAIVHPVAQKSGKNAAETSPRWCSDRVEESGDHTLYEGSDFEHRRSRPGFFEVQVLCVCCMCMCAWRMSHN